MSCHIEAIYIIALDRQFGNLSALRIKYKHIHIIAILCREINLSVSPRPVSTLDAWIKVLCKWSYLLGGDIEEEQFVLSHAWSNISRKLTAYTIEGLRITHEKNLRAIR